MCADGGSYLITQKQNPRGLREGFARFKVNVSRLYHRLGRHRRGETMDKDTKVGERVVLSILPIHCHTVFPSVICSVLNKYLVNKLSNSV